MSTILGDTAHREVHLEDYIVRQLVARGWLEGTTGGYDQNFALYPEDLVAWIQATQPKQWDKLVAGNGARTTEVLMERLAQALEREGTVNVLRRGFRIAGAGEIAMGEAEPEDQRDPTAWQRYCAQRLRVVRQLKYRPGHNLAIDLVLFVNGLPLATVELKTDFTQSAAAAMAQYKADRLPYDPLTC